MTVPLYLKVKVNEGSDPVFDYSTDTHSINFNGKRYNFNQILSSDNNSLSQLIDISTPNTYVFIGPTGAGKTTNLFNTLQCLDFSGSITAFELNDNKNYIDLLDDKALKSKIDELSKHSFNDDVILSIFHSRSTLKTSSNPTSSRSCLVITFYHPTSTTTLVDLMGNEKFDINQSNIFANVNVSSITSKLINGNNSNNLITKLIFNGNSQVNIIAHLDQFGEFGLIKSTLNNVAALVQGFNQKEKEVLSVEKRKFDDSKLPSYARPTTSSVVRTSPIRKSARLIQRSPIKTLARSTQFLSISSSRSVLAKKAAAPSLQPSTKHNRIGSLASLNLSKPTRSVPKSKLLVPTAPKLSTSSRSTRINAVSKPAIVRRVPIVRNASASTTKNVINDLRLEIKSLVSKSESLEEERDRNLEQATDLQKQVDELTSNLLGSQEQVSELSNIIENANEKIQQSKDEISVLSTENSRLISESETTLSLLKDAQTSIIQSNELVESKNAQIEALESQIEELSQTSNEKTTDMSERIEKLTQEISELEKSRQSANEALNSQLSSTSNLVKEKAALSEEISSLKVYSETLSEKQKEVINELNDKNDKLKAVISTLESQITDKVKDLDELKAREADLMSQIDQLKSRIELSQKDSSDVSEVSEANQLLTEQLAKVIEDKEFQLAETLRLNGEVAGLYEQLEKKTKATSDKVQTLKVENEALSEKAQNLLNENEALSEKASSNKRQINKLAAQVISLTEEKYSMIDELKKAKEELEATKTQMSLVETELVELSQKSNERELKPSADIIELGSSPAKIQRFSLSSNIPDFNAEEIFEDDTEDKENESSSPRKSLSPSKILTPKNENYKSMLSSMKKSKTLKRKSSSLKSSKLKSPKIRS